jgi:L-fucose mutarotase/ribose pyranase (RbsD/FucU family)
MLTALNPLLTGDRFAVLGRSRTAFAIKSTGERRLCGC